MPLNKDINHVLVIGAGPIIIGQACEFDYSGTQACMALKEEGCRVTLVNSNPATIMTDPGYADSTYIEPITPEIVEMIIEKERPNSVLPTMGGQTSLNCILALANKKVLQKYNVKIIGVTVDAINVAENRNAFKSLVENIGLKTPHSQFIKSLEEAQSLADVCQFPSIIRTSYSLGGKGGGIAYDKQQYLALCHEAMKASPLGIMVEKSIIGWKEFELEVMRDASGNRIVVCSIENIDPMGVHTGDSITVAPAQTLTDKEYQKMRSASFALMDAVGISGGCNVQFAVNPKDGEMLVIELNPRVSRSSALASKATGYPIAKIATKIALGYDLHELNIGTTGSSIPASFEPTMDYVVTKIPKFNFDKFPEIDDLLSTKMKSVGEVMGIGRSFQESLLKAIASGENKFMGLRLNSRSKKCLDDNQLSEFLRRPRSLNLWYIAEAFRRGWSIEQVNTLTSVDPWFLHKIKELVDLEVDLSKCTLATLEDDFLLTLKQKDFSDQYIAEVLKCKEIDVKQRRQVQHLQPVYKHIDSTAGEFPSKVSYLYSTYGDECELQQYDSPNKIVILGSGPNRIGQGIEFDYCCVQASKAIREDGYTAVMINSNPETVSTDYDISDQLFFEPLQLEYVLSVIEKLKPIGVITQFGGQTSIALTQGLEHSKVRILGPSAETIDLVEDRIRFRNIAASMGLKTPMSEIAQSADEAIQKVKRFSFPIIVRPSYIIGGTNITVLLDKQAFDEFLEQTTLTYPILIEEFLEDACEFDIDAISDGKNVFVCGILEHIEPVGIHSGDSHCIYPALGLNISDHDKITNLTIDIGKKTKINRALQCTTCN